MKLIPMLRQYKKNILKKELQSEALSPGTCSAQLIVRPGA